TSASAQVSEQSCTSRTWLALSPSGSFTAGQTNTNFTISINLTGLAGGTTCSGTISLAAGSSTQNVPVTLNVANSTTGTLAFSPTAVTFNASASGAAPPSQTLTVTAPTFTSATAQVSKQSCTSSNWLTLSPTGSFIAGPTTTNFSVSVNQSGLAAGTTCSGTISMTAGSVTQTVPVTMNVIAVTPGVLTLSAPGITFSAVAGGSAPDAVTFTVTSSTFTSATAQISLQTCTTRNWLTLSPIGDFTAGPTPKTFTVTADSSGMAGGTTCIGSITMTSPTGTQTVPVTLNAISTASSVLTLSASALTFSAAAGGAAPSAQTFTVTANFDTSAIAQASKQNCGTSDWLALSPTGSFTASVTETTFTVSVDPSGIAAGTTCSGTILVNAATGARRVSVTLSVVELPGPVLTVFPSAITFNAVAGGAAPIAQAFTVTAKTDVHASAKAVEASCTNSNWLTLPQSGNFVAGTAAATFTVSVDPSGIAAGTTCSGSIVISSFTESQTVSVSMIVAAPSGGGLTVTPTTLTFSFSAGDPTPASQVVTISGGGAAVPFVVVPSSSGWLQVSPSCTGVASCTTPNTGTFNLVVTASPTGLNTGTYFGSIGVSGTGLNAGSTNVNVSFTVKAPQPIISGVTNGSSFVSGPVAPGELIAIFANSATPIGPAIALKAGDATCPAPCTNLPTTMGGAQVIFQPGGIAAPLTYVSSTQITCVVPYEIAGAGSVPGSPIQLEVKYLGQSSNPVPLQYAPTQPGIFTALGTGTGLASVQQFDEQGTYQGQNSGSNPAKAGWHLTFYVTGEGMIPAPAITGKITVGADVIPLLGPPSVTIDGLPSAVSYFGEAAGFVSGMMQVNATVPAGVHTGQAVSLSLSMSGNSSQPGVTIYVK
ncbi:MAG: hypothetical protein JWP63_3726, partial [Candidatus Solibacter sp.]|nr:hypothetical protein [Candidatus Solibacter sp.]